MLRQLNAHPCREPRDRPPVQTLSPAGDTDAEAVEAYPVSSEEQHAPDALQAMFRMSSEAPDRARLISRRLRETVRRAIVGSADAILRIAECRKFEWRSRASDEQRRGFTSRRSRSCRTPRSSASTILSQKASRIPELCDAGATFGHAARRGRDRHSSRCPLGDRIGGARERVRTCFAKSRSPTASRKRTPLQPRRKAAGRQVCVNSEFPFMPMHLAAAREIGSERFGRLLFVEAHQTFVVTRGNRGRLARPATRNARSKNSERTSSTSARHSSASARAE